MAALPPGFTLDAPAGAASSAALPPGFSLDTHPSAAGDDDWHQSIPGLAALTRGVAHAEDGASNLLTDAGNVTGWNALTRAGAALHGQINQEDLNAKTSGGSLVQDLKAGRFGSALGALPGTVLESAPLLAAGALGAAAAPEAVGAVAGGALGGAALGAVTQGDAVARARAANDGRTAPDARDLAVGGLGGAAIGAGTAVAGGAMSPAAGVVARLGAGALTDAAGSAASQAAGSIGTKAGLSVDPYQVAAAAATGAATRPTLGAVSAATAAAGKLSPVEQDRTGMLADKYAAMTPEDQQTAQNTAAAGKMFQADLGDAAPNPRDPKTSATARTTGDLLSGQIRDFITAKSDAGAMTPAAADAARTALGAAQGQQRTLLQQHLDAIDSSGMLPDDATILKNALVQRGMLSDAGVANRSSGPLQSIGATVGSLAGLPVGGGHTFPGITAMKVGRAAGGALGSKLDQAFGLNDPALVKSASQAVLMLDAAGLPTPDTRAQLGQAITSTQDDIATQRALIAQQQAAEKDQATKAAAARAQAAMQLRGANNQENAANWLSGWLYKNKAGPARDAGIVGAKAIDATTPEAMFAASNGQAGSPAGVVPNMAGFRDPTQPAPEAPQADPAPQAPRVAPQASPALQQAQARSQAGPVLSGNPGPDMGPTAYGLNAAQAASPALQASAKRLPVFMHSLGNDLQNALVGTGQAQPFNWKSEATSAIDKLVADGALPEDVGSDLKSHDGLVTNNIYNAIRNKMLLKYGIDKTNQ